MIVALLVVHHGADGGQVLYMKLDAGMSAEGDKEMQTPSHDH